MSDKTEWFDPSVKPCRVGVYERLYDGHAVRFSLFDGYAWRTYELSIKHAYQQTEISDLQLPWRGLTQPPATSAPTTKDTGGEG